MSIRPGSTPAAPFSGLRLYRDYPRDVIDARLRAAEWERIARGAYVKAGGAPTPKARALARIVAVHERLAAPHWFSHESAALVWGLPVWRAPAVTHVRQPGRAGGERDRSVARHAGAVDPARLTVVGRLPVTDLTQTMLDCARALTPLRALVVADAALRAGADRDAALAVLDEIGGRRGVARARVVLGFADEGAESPGETETRFVMLRAGLPRPETQVRVETRLGTFWADLGYEEWQVLLEYDGRGKYADPQAFIDEKRRHDAILETGNRMVHVTKEDVSARAQLATRVLRLLPRDVKLVRRPLLRA